MKTMKKFFVIGGGKLQVDFIKTIKKQGYLVYVFDYNTKCEGAKLADKFYCISIDAMDEILEIAKKEKPVAIHTVATEAGNVTACYIGEKLGLNTNSYETALNTTDKDRMKKVFDKHNIPSAKAYRLYKKSDFEKYNIDYPFVVKASDRSAGRGVCLVNSFNEFEIAYADAYKESINKIVLIEEYIQGKQYSVETISQNGEHKIVAITEEYFDNEIFFVESQHLIPARVGLEINTTIETLTHKILNNFNINFGACHLELRIKDHKIQIIEIASRMGGWRDVLVSLAYELDYLSLIIDSVVGNSINVRVKRKCFSIVKMILNKNDFQLYLKLKSTEPNYIHKESIHFLGNDFESKNLIESQGYYYLKFENENKIEYFLKR